MARARPLVAGSPFAVVPGRHPHTTGYR